MTSPETTARSSGGQLGPNGSLVASPNETMAYISVGRAKLYELINANELETYVEGSSRKILSSRRFSASQHAMESSGLGGQLLGGAAFRFCELIVVSLRAIGVRHGERS